MDRPAASEWWAPSPSSDGGFPPVIVIPSTATTGGGNDDNARKKQKAAALLELVRQSLEKNKLQKEAEEERNKVAMREAILIAEDATNSPSGAASEQDKVIKKLIDKWGRDKALEFIYAAVKRKREVGGSEEPPGKRRCTEPLYALPVSPL
jgi:hypothetical protein